MGLFSKIFGNSDETQTPGVDQAPAEAGKTDDRDTSPPARARAQPAGPTDTPAKDANTSSPAEPAPRSRKPEPKVPARSPAAPPAPETAARTEAVRAASSAVQSPRPSVPPKVEAKLLSTSRADVPPRAPSSKQSGESPKRDAKRVASPPLNASAVKSVAAAPIRPVGARGANAAAAAPIVSKPETQTLHGHASPAEPPPVPARPAAAAPAQAEPLELDPLGGSVAPPRDSSPGHDDVDHAFMRIVSQAPQPPAAGSLAEDEHSKKANAEMFREMAGAHARPIKDFLLELVVGPASKQWLEVARPAVNTIQRAASELAHPDLATALVAFAEALEAATKAVGASVDGLERDRLIRAHAALSAALPQAFDLVKDRDLREPLVVRHLLLQVPGVHKVTIDKLYAAGLASLEALCRSSVDDLVQLGRLERDGADAISARFRQYWRERAAQPVHKAEERVRKTLATLLEQLGLAHQAFQRAEADEDREKKRDARNARRASSLAINVLLAQLGEVDLVEELERSPTDRRIARVRSYVDQMARARATQHQEAS
jgi:hypothetical protein